MELNNHFKCFLLSLLIALLYPNGVRGQSFYSEGNITSVSLSSGQFQYKEGQINKLRNDGAGISLALNHGFGGRGLQHELEMELIYASLKNRYDMSSFIAGYSLEYSVKKNMQLILPGGFINYSSFLYENANFDGHHNYWLSSVTVGADPTGRLVIGDKKVLFFTIKVPLFGIISRPECDRYLVLNEPDINKWDVVKRMNRKYLFSLIGTDFFIIKLKTSYLFTMKNGKMMSLGYNFSYLETWMQSKNQLLSNTLTITYQISRAK